MNLPVRETVLGATALFAQAIPPELPGAATQQLGITGAVLAALLWVIWQERQERKEMRDAQAVERREMADKFTASINQLSEAIAGLGPEKKRANGH